MPKINRNQVFYSNFMGRQPGIFRSSFLYITNKTQSE